MLEFTLKFQNEYQTIMMFRVSAALNAQFRTVIFSFSIIPFKNDLQIESISS